MSNFEFLKNIDIDIYELINKAENLYRDEYFEQCIIQTRKFAENVCKNILKNDLQKECSFDEMLATLKDKSNNSEQEKEFIEDLYFIKREGNASAHCKDVKQAGIKALECLKRAFEVSINYAVYYKNGNENILNKHYSVEVLVNGKSNKNSLSEKYQKVKIKTKKKTKQQYTVLPQKTIKFKKRYMIGVSIGISLCFALIIFILAQW